MSAVVIDAVVADGGVKLVDEAFYRARIKRAAKAWGAGVEIVIRIEPKDEAVALNQYRHLFGHVFEPVSDYTGYAKQELCLMAKAQFMPDDGRSSLTQLNHDEMDIFIKQTEEWLRRECPDAFALMEPQTTAA